MTVSDREQLPTLVEAAARLQRRELSPVELVRATLRRIEAVNPKLNAYITVLAEDALRDAEVAEREINGGAYRGPLHGIPVSLKDLFWTRGVRTTAGSRILADAVPAEDGALSERLRAAGAILVGKANLMEFAYGAAHPAFGPTANPWDLSKSAYGSSGGSAAAVATGMDFGSFGSDTGGSIRIPAALCGVTGFKPTAGTISRFGMHQGSWTLDEIGPLARTVADIAVLLTAVAGKDDRDPHSRTPSTLDFSLGIERGLGGCTVGVVANFLDATVEPAVREAVSRACNVFADAGAVVRETTIPDLDQPNVGDLMKIVRAEAHYNHRDWLKHRAGDYSATVRERLAAGATVTAVEYFEAVDGRARLIERLGEAQLDIDLLLLPTIPMVSTDLADDIDSPDRGPYTAGDFIRMTSPFNLTGQPALSIPTGFSAEGHPLGLQLVGRSTEDDLVLGAGHAYQQRTDWHRRMPPLIASEHLL
jgi:aspartyl-tRNA(Asn)/glutamyl-tRNA(Gln) amidotransferase subunit A